MAYSPLLRVPLDDSQNNRYGYYNPYAQETESAAGIARSPLETSTPQVASAPIAPVLNSASETDDQIIAKGGIPDAWYKNLSKPAAPPEKGFVGKLGQALGGGVDTLMGNLKATGNVYMGDYAGVEANAKTAQEQALNRPKEQQAFGQAMAALPDNPSFIEGVKGMAGAIWEQPQGALQEFVAQAPNSAAVMGGMATGGALGSAVLPGIGTAVGAILGGFLGNLGIETGARLMESGADGLTPAEAQQGMSEGALKAAGVTGVDVATLGASRWLMGAPSRAASKAIMGSLTKAGVDVADDAAVATAMQTLGVGSEALLQGARAMARSTGRAPLRTLASAALETVGEGSGEYLGEVMATGQGSMKEALLESIMAAPMSAGEIVWAKSDANQPFKLGTALQRATGTDLSDPQAVDNYIATNLPHFAALSLDQDQLGITTKDEAMQALGNPGAPLVQRINAVAGIAADIATRQNLPAVSEAWLAQAKTAMENGETIKVPGYTQPIPAYQQQQQANRQQEKPIVPPPAATTAPPTGPTPSPTPPGTGSGTAGLAPKPIIPNRMEDQQTTGMIPRQSPLEAGKQGAPTATTAPATDRVAQQGLQPGTPEYQAAWDQETARQDEQRRRDDAERRKAENQAAVDKKNTWRKGLLSWFESAANGDKITTDQEGEEYRVIEQPITRKGKTLTSKKLVRVGGWGDGRDKTLIEYHDGKQHQGINTAQGVDEAAGWAEQPETETDSTAAMLGRMMEEGKAKPSSALVASPLTANTGTAPTPAPERPPFIPTHTTSDGVPVRQIQGNEYETDKLTPQETQGLRVEPKKAAPVAPTTARNDGETYHDWVTRTWTDAQRRPTDGAWDGSTIENTANAAIKPLAKKLDKGGWSTLEALAPKSRSNQDPRPAVADHLSELRQQGTAQIAWDNQGNPHYAKADEAVPAWLTTQPDEQAMQALPDKPAIGMQQRLAQNRTAAPINVTPAIDATTPRTPDPVAQNAAADLPIVDLPIENLQLSKDVPQFKQGANDKGVVEPLGGKFDRTGTAPIQVWERLDGRQEVISGRHRLDLAQRSGETTIPVQVHREADGFNQQQAVALDAKLNIRDGQGKVIDYVDYFKAHDYTPEQASAEGLVARNPGKRSYTIAAKGGDTLIAQIRAGAITDTHAEAIANAAPGDDALQAVALDQMQKGRNPDQALATLQAVKAMAAPAAGGQQVDLFGFDDSQMQTAERMGAIAARKQREISADLQAINGANKNPKLAAKYGVNVDDPESLKAAHAQLKSDKDAWQNWATNPDLMAIVQAELGGAETAPAAPTAPAATTVATRQTTTPTAVKPPPVRGPEARAQVRLDNEIAGLQAQLTELAPTSTRRAGLQQRLDAALAQRTPPSLTLTPESEADLQAKADQEASRIAAEQQSIQQADAKRQADLEVDGFNLSSANVNPNQEDMFASPVPPPAAATAPVAPTAAPATDAVAAPINLRDYGATAHATALAQSLNDHGLGQAKIWEKSTSQGKITRVYLGKDNYLDVPEDATLNASDILRVRSSLFPAQIKKFDAGIAAFRKHLNSLADTLNTPTIDAETTSAAAPTLAKPPTVKDLEYVNLGVRDRLTKRIPEDNKGRIQVRYASEDGVIAVGEIIDLRKAQGDNSSSPWQTSDGQRHMNLAKAKQHELDTKVLPKLRNEGYLAPEVPYEKIPGVLSSEASKEARKLRSPRGAKIGTAKALSDLVAKAMDNGASRARHRFKSDAFPLGEVSIVVNDVGLRVDGQASLYFTGDKGQYPRIVLKTKDGRYLQVGLQKPDRQVRSWGTFTTEEVRYPTDRQKIDEALATKPAAAPQAKSETPAAPPVAAAPQAETAVQNETKPAKATWQMNRDEYFQSLQANKERAYRNQEVARLDQDLSILRNLYADEIRADTTQDGIRSKIEHANEGVMRLLDKQEIKGGDQNTFSYAQRKIGELYDRAVSEGKTLPDMVAHERKAETKPARVTLEMEPEDAQHSPITTAINKANRWVNALSDADYARLDKAMTGSRQAAFPHGATLNMDPDKVLAIWQQQLEKAKKVEPADTATVTNFGEQLPPSRREQARKLSEAMTDEQLASEPLSKIWPLKDVEEITDPFAAAVAHAARAEIPSKPRSGWKLDRWVANVKMLREIASLFVDNKLTRQQFAEHLKQFPTLKEWQSKVLLLEQLDRSQWSRIGTVRELPHASTMKDGVLVTDPAVIVQIDDKSQWFRGTGKATEHLDAIKALLGDAAAEKQMQFEIRVPRDSSLSPYIIKLGDGEKRKLMTFATTDEARDALKNRYAELVQAWEDVKARDNITEADLRTQENLPRTGQDWRQGKDVTTEEFQNTFRFRGGEWGKWVSQGAGRKQRQDFLNQTYDALMDLASIINVPPQALSLNGTLGIAFGARGSGSASAHFEPSNLVINLTKTRGAGSLAHELFHALDNYFSRQRGVPTYTGDDKSHRDNSFITHKPEPLMVRKDGKGSPVTRERLAEWRKSSGTSGYLAEDAWMVDPQHPEGVRPEVEERMVALVKALNDSPMLHRSMRLDGRKSSSDGYWSRTLERAARAFENYVILRMHEQGYSNDFLANVIPADKLNKNAGRYPYLLPEEMAPITQAFDDLFATIQTREDAAGNVSIFEDLAGYDIPTGIAEKKAVPSNQGAFDFAPAPTPTVNRAQSRDNFFLRFKHVATGAFRSGLDTVTTPEEVAHLVAPLRKHAQEQFYAVVTDANGKVLDVQLHTKGGRAESMVYPEVLVPAIAAVDGGTQVWFAHNHPSGAIEVSMPDLRINNLLAEKLKAIGIHPSGHIIVGRGSQATFFTEDSGTLAQGITITPLVRNRSIPITERQIRSQPRSQLAAITNPDQAKAFAQGLQGSNVLVLLDNKHVPVATLDMTQSEMGMLRKNEQIPRLMQAIDATNAPAALIKSRHEYSATNLMRMLTQVAGTRVIDAIIVNADGTLESKASQGTLGSGAGVWFSLRSAAQQNPRVNRLRPHLTPEEQAKLHLKTAEAVLTQFEQLPSINEMSAVALAGIAKRGWYAGSTEALVHVFGPDAPRFTALLAALSPQNKVEDNLANTLKVWREWLAAGRPTSRAAIMQAMGRGVWSGAGEASVLPAWRNNAIRVLQASDPETVVLSGPKVHSFYRNLQGHVHEVTNDAWIANYAAVDQKIFGGALNASGTDPGKGTGYLAMSARVRAAAQNLTKLTGETWTPAEVQETIWSWAKTAYELASRRGETRSVQQLLKDGAITDELINATPDFRTLFHADTYQQILIAAGYGEQVATLSAANRRDANAGNQESRTPGQAGPFAQDTQQRYLERAAKRLDRLRAQRQAEEAAKQAASPSNASDSTNSDISFAKTDQATTPASRPALRQAIARLMKPWANAPQFEVFTGLAEMPPAVQAAYERQRQIKLQADPNAPADYVDAFWHQGKVWINSEAVPDASTLATTLRHETLGHHGLRALFGRELVPILDRVLASQADLVAAKAKVYGLDMNKRLDALSAAEEVLAEWAQTRPTMGVIRQLVAMIRAQLRKWGVLNADSLTRDEILREYVIPARGWVERGNAKAGGLADALVPAFEKTEPTNNDIRFSLSPRQNTTLEGAWNKLNLAPEKQQTLTDQVRTLLSKNWRQAITDFKANSYEGLFDGLINIDRAEKEVGVTDFAKRGYVSTRMAAGIADILWGVLNKGAPEWRNGVLAYKRGTQGLLTTLGNLGPDMRDWLGWMAGNRANQLLAEGREHNLDQAEIDELIALATPAKAQKFMEAKAAYNALNTAMLDVAQQAGLIDPASRAKWESEWYVPFYRQLESEGEATLLGPHTSRGLSHQSSGIRALKGGAAPTADLLANILTNWTKLLDASLKNHALSQVADNLSGTRFMVQVLVSKPEMIQRLKDSPELVYEMADWLGLPEGDIDYVLAEIKKMTRGEMEKMWTKVAPTAKDIIRVQRNGKNFYYKVLDAGLLRSIESFGFMGFNDPLTRTARSFKRLLTTGVTSMPEFIIRNFVRDAVQAWAINKDGMQFASSAIKGIRKTYGESDAYWDLVFSGGAFQGGYVHGTDPEAAAQMVRRSLGRKGLIPAQIAAHERGVLATKDKVVEVLDKYWEKYRAWGDKAENINRLATYESAIAAGKSPLQAAYEAKDLMDYSLRGNYQLLMRFTDMVPFLNARIQGLGKLGRAGLADPRIIGMKLAKIAAFSVALAMLNGDDDRYKELEDWKKDAYWHFWLGDQHFMIPKPFEIGVLAGTLPERMWNTFVTGNQENDKMWWSVKHNILGTFNFNPIPQVAMPVIENVANRSFFFDRPIENMRDLGQLPANRFDSRTSDTMRVLGSWLGASPKQLEHLTQGYLGTLGVYLMGLSDAMVRWGEGAPEKPSMAVGDWPIVRSFMQGSGPARNTVWATDLFDAFQEVEMIHRTLNDMKKEGRIDQAKALQQQSAAKLRYRPQLLAAKKRLDEIRRQMTAITDSRMTGTMKRQRLDRLTIEKNRLSERVARQITPAF